MNIITRFRCSYIKKETSFGRVKKNGNVSDVTEKCGNMEVKVGITGIEMSYSANREEE